MKTEDKKTATSFLSGGGEMGALMRAKDWSTTPVGLPETWPQSLRTTLSIILHSKFPMFLWWGAELICFYNDAYRPSLGEKGKHPAILGQPAAEAWTEIWTIIKPLIDQVLTDGESTWSEDQLIPIYRNGKLEDVYWTFSYSPVNDESGTPMGVLVTCYETTEKIGILNAIKESEDQLQFTLEAAELATWNLNPLTNKFIGNDRLKEWFGLATETKIPLSVALNAVIEADRQKVIDAITEALKPGSSGNYNIEYTIRNLHTGQERIVVAKGKALFNNNVAFRFSGTMQDITEQVVARNKIEENEKEFRNTVKHVPVGITILRGPDFIVEMANETYLQIVDKTEQDFVGKPLFISLPEVKDAVFSLLTGVLTTGTPCQGTEFPVTLNRFGKKELAYFNFTYQALRESNGNISGIVVVANDATASVKGKHELAEGAKQFRNMVMQSPIPMTIFRGPEYIIEMANTVMFENIWRRKECDVIGKPVLEVFPELNAQKYPELLNKVYTTGLPHRENESVADVQGDDSLKRFYLDFEYLPLFETDGSVSGIMVTVNDVTEKVEAKLKLQTFTQKLEQQVQERTRELEQKNNDLEKTNADLQSFAYVSSHDLQEPLRKIQTFANRILEKESEGLSDKGKDYFSRMQKAANRMQKLIDDLLAYSRTNTTERNFQRVELQEIVNEVKNEFKESLLEKNARIDILQTCIIDVIPFQFHQLLHNLIGNSLKFSKETEPLHIQISSEHIKGDVARYTHLDPKNTYSHISISDNGIGFDPQYKDRIFEVFQRLHGKDEYKGTGIGLAIVKKIVENHNGCIIATGRLDEGAVFDIFIPAR